MAEPKEPIDFKISKDVEPAITVKSGYIFTKTSTVGTAKNVYTTSAELEGVAVERVVKTNKNDPSCEIHSEKYAIRFDGKTIEAGGYDALKINGSSTENPELRNKVIKQVEEAMALQQGEKAPRFTVEEAEGIKTLVNSISQTVKTGGGIKK